MAEITIRPFIDQDAAAWLEAHHQAVRAFAINDYSPEVIEEWAPPVTGEAVAQVIANSDNETRLIAEHEGKIIGIAALVIGLNELRACYVAPEGARRGVGRALVSEIERIASEHGLAFLHLEGSLNAKAFYRVLGYEVVERGEHIMRSGRTMPCVKMRKDFRVLPFLDGLLN